MSDGVALQRELSEALMAAKAPEPKGLSHKKSTSHIEIPRQYTIVDALKSAEEARVKALPREQETLPSEMAWRGKVHAKLF